jgi:hypothetical protein
LTAAVRYAQQHGGGTIGVESQSSAAQSIVASDANVAGLGGFSGRESSVSVTWLADAIRSGRLRWILAQGEGTVMPGPGGDARTGSQNAFSVVAKTCRAATVSGVTLYDCQGKAAALEDARAAAPASGLQARRVTRDEPGGRRHRL